MEEKNEAVDRMQAET